MKTRSNHEKSRRQQQKYSQRGETVIAYAHAHKTAIWRKQNAYGWTVLATFDPVLPFGIDRIVKRTHCEIDPRPGPHWQFRYPTATIISPNGTAFLSTRWPKFFTAPVHTKCVTTDNIAHFSSCICEMWIYSFTLIHLSLWSFTASRPTLPLFLSDGRIVQPQFHLHGDGTVCIRYRSLLLYSAPIVFHVYPMLTGSSLASIAPTLFIFFH